MAKDVSIRLHNELDAVEKKRSRLEQENEELRVKLQDLEVAKQVLQAEMEKTREVRDNWSFQKLSGCWVDGKWAFKWAVDIWIMTLLKLVGNAMSCCVFYHRK